VRKARRAAIADAIGRIREVDRERSVIRAAADGMRSLPRERAARRMTRTEFNTEFP